MTGMSEHDTGIEWTHVPGYKGATWNPVRGCTKISPGCKHCYAETFAERWRGVPGQAYEQGFDLRLVPEKLDEPLRKTKPHAYFVNSMSDLHQDGIPHEFVRQVYAVMQCAGGPPGAWAGRGIHHLFMVLTKRAETMRDAVISMIREAPLVDGVVPAVVVGRYQIHAPYFDGPPPNVWLGVSVEDRKYGVPRIDVLRQIPAAVRFLSIEPLLEDLGDLDLRGIDWVLVGGESGHNARPFAVEWALRIVKQCRDQGVPVFVKQPGHRPVAAGAPVPIRSKSDRAALARYGLDIREWPKVIQSRAA